MYKLFTASVIITLKVKFVIFYDTILSPTNLMCINHNQQL